MIVPISEGSYGYAAEVRKALHAAGFHATAELTDKKMQKKVRKAGGLQHGFTRWS